MIVAGNWKMHHGPESARSFLRKYRPPTGMEEEPRVLIFPPALSIPAAREALTSNGGVELGAQNMHWETEGAYTGEISPPMLVELEIRHVLVGHSERRAHFGETDADVTRKVRSALEHGLEPLACVGETLEEREDGRVEEVLRRQVEHVLEGASGHAGGPGIRLAYEPVWAIGTGRTATPEDVSRAHGNIRGTLAEVLGHEQAREIPILYGGSVKPENAAGLMEAPNVDGVPVGGASLDPESFAAIVAAGSGGRKSG